jgi:hypothetical protein
MVPPGMKKPLDIAETVENKISGLVAAGAVIPSLVALGSKLIMDSAGLEHAPVMAGTFGLLPLAAVDMSWLLAILMVPLSIAVFAVVWVVGHAINVLILISPWGGLDTALKGIRTSVLSLVAGTAFIDPVVGATLSVVIILVAYLMAGWAFRLMVFGSVFSWDFFTFRRTRFQLLADANKLFTARDIADAPLRTYGRLHQDADGKLLFKFRPWLVMPERTVEVPRDGLVVGKGVFFSEVLGFDQTADKNTTLLLLPPRYVGHEELFARTYRISGTCDVGPAPGVELAAGGLWLRGEEGARRRVTGDWSASGGRWRRAVPAHQQQLSVPMVAMTLITTAWVTLICPTSTAQRPSPANASHRPAGSRNASACGRSLRKRRRATQAMP